MTLLEHGVNFEKALELSPNDEITLYLNVLANKIINLQEYSHSLSQQKYKYNPLQIAVIAGHFEMVKGLLEAGSEMFTRDQMPITLKLAVYSNNIEMVKLLLPYYLSDAYFIKQITLLYYVAVRKV